jgi:hypothetical protein
MSDTTPGCVYSKEKSRRGYSPLPAVDPHDGKTWTVLLPHKMVSWIAARGRGAALELGYTVPWALLNPRHVFRGIRDDDSNIDDDGWLCYVSRPTHAFDWKTHKRGPSWPGEVFLVYVTDERVVYCSTWVKCDPNDPDLPIDFEDRFKVRVF